MTSGQRSGHDKGDGGGGSDQLGVCRAQLRPSLQAWERKDRKEGTAGPSRHKHMRACTHKLALMNGRT